MNNIFKKWKISLVIVGIVVGIGYVTTNGESNIEKNYNDESINNSNNEIVLSSLDGKSLEYEDIESDYKELEYLESILNDKYFVLINRDNKLDKSYVPSNLKKSEAKFLDYVQDNNLESATSDAARKMFEAAAQDGISLIGVSGYRSYSLQKKLYENRVREKGEEKTRAYTAEPGASEHQSGLAIDILCNEYQTLDEGFENTDAFRWLTENCYKYGFILRYLNGKEDITGYNYEPWHFRYIGNEEIAEDIMNRGLTFEEYINEVKSKIDELKNRVKMKKY
ncbi:MAG: M15 family metallopeptidase [Clostridium celatum]|nr:M15 family metallopeptidase [Clostridium celatum]